VATILAVPRLAPAEISPIGDFSDRRIDSALWAPDTPVRQKVAGFPHFCIEQLPQGSSDSSTRLFLDE
jgi:hypothetical protein